MTKVPVWNLKPLRSIYNPADGGVGPATTKQKNLIIVLCEQRKLPPPDLTQLTRGQASTLISRMLD